MNPYRLADRAAKKLNRIILRRIEQTKRRLSILKFDDLNVMRQTDALYSNFLKDSKKELKALFIARYIEVWTELKKKEPREDMLDELADMYLAGLLEEPNDVTHYVFEAELIRKRDRAKEAILSVPTRTQKQLEIDKAARIFAQMLGWYTDFASQDAEIQAMEDAGIKKVVRHELMDSRVCSVCRKANGEIYEIEKIPPLPHLRCRRYFTPYTG
jgi:anion-transporting  ArsA/GET3 family ATPase